MAMRLVRRSGYLALEGGPVPRGAAAITLGPVVSIRADSVGHERLEAHEAVHVRQWRAQGWLWFAASYLGGYLGGRLAGRSHHDAYLHLPAEAAAEWEAQRVVRGLTVR